MRRVLSCSMMLAVTFVLGCEASAPVKEPPLLMGEPLEKRAEKKSAVEETSEPDVRVKFETSKGEFVIGVYKNWSPKGAERFLELVEAGFYGDCRFFRVVPDFMVQWGINGDPAVMKKWRDANIPDDRPSGANRKSNQRGYVTFAKASFPNSRSTQLFINFKDNSFLDRDGFTPFGKVLSGMEIVDAINSKNGERPDQGAIQDQGNDYLNKYFPDLDYIKSAKVIGAGPAAASTDKPKGGDESAKSEAAKSETPETEVAKPESAKSEEAQSEESKSN